MRVRPHLTEAAENMYPWELLFRAGEPRYVRRLLTGPHFLCPDTGRKGVMAMKEVEPLQTVTLNELLAGRYPGK